MPKILIYTAAVFVIVMGSVIIATEFFNGPAVAVATQVPMPEVVDNTVPIVIGEIGLFGLGWHWIDKGTVIVLVALGLTFLFLMKGSNSRLMFLGMLAIGWWVSVSTSWFATVFAGAIILIALLGVFGFGISHKQTVKGATQKYTGFGADKK